MKAEIARPAAPPQPFALPTGVPAADFVMPGRLGNLRNWRAKVQVNNQGADLKRGVFDEVGYVMIDAAADELIPISRADEHHKGFDMLDRMRRKWRIEPERFHPVFGLSDYYLYDEAQIPEALAALGKFRAWGGPNLAVRGAYGDMRKVLMSFDGFLAAKGDVTVAPGKLAEIGAGLVTRLDALQRALRAAMDRPDALAVSRVWRAAQRLHAHFEASRALGRVYRGNPEEDPFLTGWEAFVGARDWRGLDRAAFSHFGFKQRVHDGVRLALADPRFVFADDVVAVFGDLGLANDMLGRMGEPGAPLPEIKAAR